MNKRLSRWQGHFLSIVGRITLAKSVLQSIPNYIMQFVLLSVSICDDIDKKCRSFVWGDIEAERKSYTLA